MMQETSARVIKFYKYVSAGNDFIILNNLDSSVELTERQIIALCDRRLGIGADGILLLSPAGTDDFRMEYFNSDGSRGKMCGNGARSVVKFAAYMGIAGEVGSFLADDGIHGYLIQDSRVSVEILVKDSLHPWDVPRTGCGFINTGVPHLVIPVINIAHEDLDQLGNAMNIHKRHPEGTNVNIVQRLADELSVRTWERGVNMETLACGTGATAVAIFASQVWGLPWPITMDFAGGRLEVDNRRNQYWLRGPTQLVFEGQIELSNI